MKINELANLINGKVLSCKDNKKIVQGVYICDLLSFALAKIKENDAWITIQSNINVVAVASLTDASCVILAENVEIENDVIKAAEEKEVTFISTDLNAYEICKILSKKL